MYTLFRDQNILELELFVTELCAEMLREGMFYILM